MMRDIEPERARSKSPKITVNYDDATNILLRELVKKRGVVRGRLTRFSTFISGLSKADMVSSQARADLKLRINGATTLFSEFNNIQTKLEEAVSEDDLSEQLNQRELFEDNYYSTLARAECMLNGDNNATNSNICQNESIKLPTISVPTFDGSCERWLEFRDTFLSLVHNSTHISNIQKFHYLKSSLKGCAALVIDSLEFSADNYTVAWELILNRYNNNRLLVHNHVKALFTMQPLNKESPELLRNLIDNILRNLRALKILGEPVDSWDTLIIYLIVTKLDKTTEREWEQHKNTFCKQSADSKQSLKVEVLLSFLKDRADMLETLLVSHSNTKHNEYKSQRAHNNNQRVNCNVVTNKPPLPPRFNSISKGLCILCNAKHPLYACQLFLEKRLDSKLKLINDNNLCVNCLRSGHLLRDCRMGPCRKCNLKHNTIIHDDNIHSSASRTLCQEDAAAGASGLSRPSPPTALDAAASHSQTRSNVLCNNYPCGQPVLLSTALVQIVDKQGVYHDALALLDSGSERCIITRTLCDTLNLPLRQSIQEIRGVGNSIAQSTETCKIELKSRISSYVTTIHCFVLPHITCTNITILPEQHAQFRVPNNLQLANPHFNNSQRVDLLLGADIFWDLLVDGKIRLPNGPCLQNTHLGWLISGPVLNSRGKGHFLCNLTRTLDNQLRKFWELEEVPTLCDTRSDEERECENHFMKNTIRNSDGRFCVSIPLKSSPHNLGESYQLAFKRFLALEKRLSRTPQYKAMYSQFIHTFIDLGHMSPVNTYITPHYFMPHHGVFREHSVTTKLRVVFDASAPSSTGTSFNDLQLVGPPIQGDLFAILLRLRQHRFIACADVEKMYRQVLVTENQRDMQLIIWRDSPTEPLGIFRINTVVYGTAAAPYLAVKCLKSLADSCPDPDVTRVVKEDFYVDDLITGADDKLLLIRLCEKTTHLLQSGCFPLRKWIFNFEHNNTLFKQTEENKSLNLQENSQCKTLGIDWNHSSDTLTYNTQFKTVKNNVSKRLILSCVSQIYDPLGLLSPTIMIAKVLLQRLWLLKAGWDDDLPHDITVSWNKFVNCLSSLKDISVPRHAIGINANNIQLHIFTDASQTAYGACAYVRSVSAADGKVTVKLLCSKGKVAPLKPVTIPRLELCGALLGARLYAKVIGSLRCKIDEVMFWTDSTIVLGWLRMPPNLLKTFVQNRVSEIHDLTRDLPWRHVSGNHNPADMVSRGVSLPELVTSKLWWEGPEMINNSNFVSVNSEPSLNTCENDELTQEIRPNSINVLITKTNNEIFPFKNFSRFDRMKRTFAYVLRFINNARKIKSTRQVSELTVEELCNSELALAKLSQRECFGKELELLAANKPLRHNPSLFKLNLFLDDHGIIRIGGRLSNSHVFEYDKMHPVLLSSKHKFTALLFREEHVRLLHAGAQALLYDLRQRWWPVGGRNLARQIVNECILCKRLKGTTLKPLMGNLPKERITPSLPFVICGVDYAGPFYTLSRKGRGAKTSKSYICLFVCFVTRAVHLELVTDLSSETYILALKRFVSRRGKPSEIYSDNGKNFVGAMNEFAKTLQSHSSSIIKYAHSQSIKFKFIPVYSPHFGGLWESGIKSCKYHLIRVVGQAHLTFEELTTVLVQIEAILNSRPLSPLSSDPNDFLPLSPAHFLVGRPLTATVSADLQEKATHLLTRFQRVEQLRQHFWSRWAKEYISELQVRCKWNTNSDTLQPNTLVVIKEDHLSPLRWALGRIVKTYPGRDGISRVADILTSSGIVRRAFSKIVPLFHEDTDILLEEGASKAGGMSRNGTSSS